MEDSALFVGEEDLLNINSDSDSVEFHEAHEMYEVEDDPIMESIPIVLKSVPERKSKSVHVLQHVGRPKENDLKDLNREVKVKQDANVIEMGVPRDTTRFFDQSRVKEWNTEGSEQRLQGVFDKSNGGLYAGQVQTNEVGVRRLVLVPVDSTVQLRTSFAYLDEIENAKQGLNGTDSMVDHKPSNVQILQTSAKPIANPSSNDPFTGHNLGGALKSLKKFEEEKWSTLKWHDKNSERSLDFKRFMTSSEDHIILQNISSPEDYLNQLLGLSSQDI